MLHTSCSHDSAHHAQMLHSSCSDIPRFMLTQLCSSRSDAPQFVLRCYTLKHAQHMTSVVPTMQMPSARWTCSHNSAQHAQTLHCKLICSTHAGIHIMHSCSTIHALHIRLHCSVSHDMFRTFPSSSFMSMYAPSICSNNMLTQFCSATWLHTARTRTVSQCTQA